MPHSNIERHVSRSPQLLKAIGDWVLEVQGKSRQTDRMRCSNLVDEEYIQSSALKKRVALV
jgi:hypothetical protein